MTTAPARPLINLDALELLPLRSVLPGAPERFDARIGRISSLIGARQLGYNLTVVPPGKCAWPRHNHRNNEEMLFVIEGLGELRVGDQRFAVRAGDVIAHPAGGPDSAHQLINTGDSDLRYLAVSTERSPDVVEYPDSGKFGVRVELPPDANGQPQAFRIRGRLGPNLDYWDGEA